MPFVSGATNLNLVMNGNPSDCAIDPLGTFSTRLLCQCATGLGVPPGSSQPNCLPACSSGNFFSSSLAYPHGSCASCTSCAVGYVESEGCTTTRDTSCVSCGTGCVRCEVVEGALGCAQCDVGLVQHGGTCRSVRRLNWPASALIANVLSCRFVFPGH